MLRAIRLFACASAGALILGAAPDENFAFVAPAHAQAPAVSAPSIAPPPLPSYSQSALPGPGYIWIPGDWAWDSQGYYWVPGYWALPPAAGLLWTPAYWAWNETDKDYVYHAGYWAPTVGYYGGVNYRFGYTGEGYNGGFWRNRQFIYNRAVDDLGTAHVPSYANQVFAPDNHLSYNGGPGGTTAQPTAAQRAFMGEHHVAPTPVQIQHQETASRIPTQRYSANKGSPPIGAVARANDFSGADTGLPLMHSVAGAPPNGPLVGTPAAQHGGALQNGPTAATGAVQNFTSHAVTIRSPTTKPKPAPRPTPP